MNESVAGELPEPVARQVVSGQVPGMGPLRSRTYGCSRPQAAREIQAINSRSAAKTADLPMLPKAATSHYETLGRVGAQESFAVMPEP